MNRCIVFLTITLALAGCGSNDQPPPTERVDGACAELLKAPWTSDSCGKLTLCSASPSIDLFTKCTPLCSDGFCNVGNQPPTVIGTYREVGDQNVQDISLEEQQGTSIKVDLDASSQWIENNIRLDLSDAQVFGSQSAFSVYIAVSTNAPLTRVSVITGTLEDCGQMRLKERTIISEDNPALASMDNEWYVVVSDNDVSCQSN